MVNGTIQRPVVITVSTRNSTASGEYKVIV